MIGGGVVAALLACQVASESYRGHSYETPSYTVKNPTYPRASETASITPCLTAMQTNFSTGSL